MIWGECPISIPVVQILGLRDVEQHQQGSCLFPISFACLAAVSGCPLGSGEEWCVSEVFVMPNSYPWSLCHRSISAPGPSFPVIRSGRGDGERVRMMRWAG